MRAKDELDAMLGAARFEKYFAVAGEDVEKAVQLYRWNTRLAGAFHSQLSYFEVPTFFTQDGRTRTDDHQRRREVTLSCRGVRRSAL
ncbi:hypothetical protein [Corynebacterium suedekumii]|uniref:Uncharacterized protein n=1 Tax=Corynebacterium suedekumii TaxID=3049801 RepID=A0ABY8VN54_9CORY|nr:hypothetical protein [Corynebacterium suedekumii]WIM70782.1 hypothetical protein QP029_02840 [Corynebacterium suedekumii]